MMIHEKSALDMIFLFVVFVGIEEIKKNKCVFTFLLHVRLQILSNNVQYKQNKL
jgi:hypothetical protein